GCSAGGRRGATCASATSAGASITSLPRSRSPHAPSAVPCRQRSAPATTRRSWRHSNREASCGSATLDTAPATKTRKHEEESLSGTNDGTSSCLRVFVAEIVELDMSDVLERF